MRYVLRALSILAIASVTSVCGSREVSDTAKRSEKSALALQRRAIKRGSQLYVRMSCSTANCHSFDPDNPATVSTDLLESAAMAADHNGDLLGVYVLGGTPESPLHQMPQYKGILTQADISDLAAYIHSVRQERRYASLSKPNGEMPGDAEAGQQYFTSKGCAGCHTPAAVLGKAAGVQTDDVLRSQLLRPAHVSAEGREAHARLLENYTHPDVRNLIAYIRSLQ